MTNTTGDPVPPLIKIREAAKLLSISRSTVRALIDLGDLKAFRISPGRRKQRVHLRITRESLCGFYEKRFGKPLNLAFENPFKSATK